MHSVDKWLDGYELKQDEVNRAATMREKTLQITEKQQAEIERLQKLLDDKCDRCVARDRTEATKDFADRFESLLADYEDYDTLHIYEIKDRIDIVKEMVGDDKC